MERQKKSGQVGEKNTSKPETKIRRKLKFEKKTMKENTIEGFDF